MPAFFVSQTWQCRYKLYPIAMLCRESIHNCSYRNKWFILQKNIPKSLAFFLFVCINRQVSIEICKRVDLSPSDHTSVFLP